MKKYSIILFAIAVVTFFGCQREQELENSVKTISSVSVSIDDETATKAIMDLQSGEITWNELGDRIGVFSDLHPDIVEYIWDRYEYDGQGRPIFRGEAMDGSHFFAVYPFTDSDDPDLAFNASETFRKDPNNTSAIRFVLDPANLNRGSSTYTGPVELKIPMVAKSDDANFVFKQTVSIFHFKIKGEGELPWVILTGNQHEALRGEGFIDLSEEVPVFRLDESKIEPYDPMARINNQQIGDSYSSSVSIDIDHYVLNGDDEIDVLYALPPMTFNKGISLALQYNLDEPVYEDGVSRSYDNVTKITTKSIAARRGKIKHFTIVDREIVETEREEGAEEEKEALMAIYNAMGGPSWKRVDNWGTDAPLKDWYGVEVDQFTGRVLRLYLGDNNLSGTIPEELGDLLFLEALDISDNKIVDVSSELQPLINLRGLYVGGNPWQHFPHILLQGGLVTILSVSFDSEASIPEDFWELSGNLETLEFNCPTIPAQIMNLNNISSLRLSGFSGSIPEELCQLSGLQKLYLNSEGMSGGVPTQVNGLESLILLDINGPVSGEIPEEVFLIPHLQEFVIVSPNLSGTIPSSIGQAQELWRIEIHGPISGPLPVELYNCKSLKSIRILEAYLNESISLNFLNLPNLETLVLANCGLTGPIPKELFLMSSLTSLDLAMNHLSGNIPVELVSSNIFSIDLTNNVLSGTVNPAFKNWSLWNRHWGEIVYGNRDLDISQCMPSLFNFSYTCLDGTEIDSQTILKRPLTIFFQWAFWCYYSCEAVYQMKQIYEQYVNTDKIDFYGYIPIELGGNYPQVLPYIYEKQMPWKNFVPDHSYPYIATPEVTVYNNTGTLVFSSVMSDLSDLPRFLSNWFGEDTPDYESENFGADGNVHTLQTATECNGINVVLMGDAFSDRLIADKTYDTWMRRAADAIFEEEPYKTYRNYFNVSYVDVVSKNESYDGETALETYYGAGSKVGGNDGRAIYYARKVLGENQIDDALIIVLMNRDYYAGTCYMYYDSELGGDNGRGLSIAYVPTCSDISVFSGAVSHEASGHGFAKLADEYSYKYMGAISAEEIASYRARFGEGWWKNVDFTSDPQSVKWSAFLSDSRYENDGLGVFEGACTYWEGAYRPTDESIMRFNTGGFNAPSRYAIWYRINKLAYGAEWNGTYDDFVTFDMACRASASPTQATRSTKTHNFVEKEFEPLAPPVVVNKDWRQVAGRDRK